MLIDFTVENYRSIKEPVTLSAVAQSSNEQDNKIAEPYSFPARKLEILPVLGIFGANASGKSNVVNALGELLSYIFYNQLVETSLYSDLKFITPFKLDPRKPKCATNFELRVLREGNIYIFQLSVDRNQILSEKLQYIPRESKNASPRRIFERIWSEKAKAYSVKNSRDFGNAYKKIQLSLKNTQTFLGFLVNHFDNELLAPLTLWLGTYWKGLSLNDDIFDHQAACGLLTGRISQINKVSWIRKIRGILQKFDTGIGDFEIKEYKNESGTIEFEVWVTHNKNGAKVKWLLEEESLGTQKLFLLATKLLFAFETGGLMLVDELGFGTHPHINRELVRLFQNKLVNKNGAQLIFTSHDSNLLRKGVLRRDQVWFTEKREDASTDLYSLLDFGARPDLVLDKAYLDGRFGAVPFLPDKEGLTELLGV